MFWSRPRPWACRLSHRPWASGTRGRHQRRFATADRQVRVATGAQQQADCDCVSVDTGNRKRRDRVTVGSIRGGTRRQQFAGQNVIITPYCPMQGGHAILLRSLHIHPLEQQR